MRKILTSFSLVAASLAFAQVGINADESDIAKDAVFHVENKSGEAKGVILPSVSLTAADDQTTITGAGGQVTTGLMVWNDGTAGLTPAGYYYWDGVKWVLTGNVDAGSGYKNVVVTDASHTFGDDDYFVKITGGGGVSVTFPTGAENIGRELCVFNASTGNVTLSPGDKIILGFLPNPFTANYSGCFIFDGTNWNAISNY